MDRLETFQKKSKKLASCLFGAAVMLITLGAGCASEQPQVEVQTDNGAAIQVTPLPPASPPPTEPPTPTPTTTPPTPKPGASSYRDGTYTAQGEYFTHVGPESVSVTLTLKRGIITDSQFQATPNAQMSGFYQNMFASDYKPLVIGQSIDSVNLDKVSGSSLTPMGFNDSVSKIKVEAKA